MPADKKITPTLQKRLVRLHEAKKSLRFIARELEISVETARRWLDERGLKAHGTNHGGGHPRATKMRSEPTQDEAKRLAAEIAKAEAELDGPGAAKTVLRRRLAMVRASIETHYQSFIAGTFPAAAFERLTGLERRYALALQEIEPPAKDDPEKDPGNLEAEERLTQKLEALIARTDRERVCVHCHQHPDR